jgi:glycosyltransferase involved in cell wall biosynthesis
MRLRSLRVLTIAHNAVAASNRQRTAALAARPDVRVSLLTPPWWHEEGRRIATDASTPWRVGRTAFTGNGTRYFYLQGLARAVREVQPDVIDLYEEPFSVVALQTVLVRRGVAPRAALVFYSAVNVERTWRRPYRWIEQLVLRTADGAYVPNRDVGPILRRKGFASRKPIAVIPLGIDAACFQPPETSPTDRGTVRRIGFVGRLEAVKGLDVLLDAFDALQVPAQLVIAGDGAERSALVARVARSPRKAAVHLVPAVPFEALPELLHTLDVLVLPSVTILPLHREQFGRVLVEAMAAGVPVVGSSSGAIPEVIGDAGLVVPERDAPALARALEQVLLDDALRRELVARGTAAARDRFAWRTVAEQTVELFRLAIAGRSERVEVAA